MHRQISCFINLEIHSVMKKHLSLKQGSVNLGAMNTLLLQKVEELTRYVIDLQKQIDELKNGKE